MKFLCVFVSFEVDGSVVQEFGFAMSPSLVFDFPNVRALEVWRPSDEGKQCKSSVLKCTLRALQ